VFRQPTPYFHMILVSPPYRHEIGVSFSRAPGTIPPGSYSSQCAGRPSMFRITVRCVGTPDDFWRTFSVIHSKKTGAVKALDNNAGTSQSSKLLRRVACSRRTKQPVPGAATGPATKPPPPKGLTTSCALA